jgi:hypothetical protein
LDLQLHMQSVPITGFVQVLWFPRQIKLTATI